jgi:glycosyltransferase involved in cell wall biosynthesis
MTEPAGSLGSSKEQTGAIGLAVAEREVRRVAAAARTRLSVIVPVNQDRPDLAEVYRSYEEILGRLGLSYELIYLVGRESGRALATLKELKEESERLQIVVFGQWLGEPAALTSGVKQAQGEIILTLPADPQIDPADIPRVIAALDDCDMAVGRRWPLVNSPLHRLQARAFHWLLRSLFGHSFNDLVCRVRACRREVLDEIGVYGLQHHFVPLLASERGFRTCEVNVRPGTTGASVKLGLLGGLRVALDILALYLVLKFTKRPLRFFGMVGLPVLAVGLAYTGALTMGRLFFGMPLADRPALILGVLMIVLGIQILALGLIGELIVFASGRKLKDYSIEKIV